VLAVSSMCTDYLLLAKLAQLRKAHGLLIKSDVLIAFLEFLIEVER
jgi:hypothetical protein